MQSWLPSGLTMQLHELLNLRSPYVILSTGEVHWHDELVHTQLEAIEAAEQFCALRKSSLTVFLSVQQSQALRVALEEEPQPHWLAVMGALVRLKRGNRELEQLQAKERADQKSAEELRAPE